MKKQQYILFLLMMCCASFVFSTSIYFDKGALQNSKLLNYTIQDVSTLLQQSKALITDKETDANWKIVFQLDQDVNSYKTLYDANTKATQQFTIQSSKENNVCIIVITSQSEKGLSNGLYYFMQNKLGFQFYHPKETILPDLSNYVLDTFTETITPRFDKIGFHIHAMHPLEITEALAERKYTKRCSRSKNLY
jgi:hypothetical protein